MQRFEVTMVPAAGNYRSEVGGPRAGSNGDQGFCKVTPIVIVDRTAAVVFLLFPPVRRVPHELISKM